MRVIYPAALTIIATVLLSTAVFRASVADDAPASSNAPANTAPAAPPPPASVTVLNKHEVEGILGREVLSSANENMGRIVDVLVDRSGEVRAAIIDFGGFL